MANFRNYSTCSEWVCGKKHSMCTDYAEKNIPRVLSMREKIFYVYWVCGTKFSTCTEHAVKIFLRVLSMRYKIVIFLEVLNMHKRHTTLKIFTKTHFRHTYGSKNNHHQHLILVYLQFFFFFTAHWVCGKKPKNLRNQGLIDKNIYFWSSP